MSCNLRAFSSLTAKRRYTLKSPALAFLKLNMYVGVGLSVHILTTLRAFIVCYNRMQSSWTVRVVSILHFSLIFAREFGLGLSLKTFSCWFCQSLSTLHTSLAPCCIQPSVAASAQRLECRVSEYNVHGVRFSPGNVAKPWEIHISSFHDVTELRVG